MPKSRPARFVALVALLARLRPDVDASAIAERRVVVDGRIVDNPLALVRRDAAVRVLVDRPLRGSIKLAAAIDAFAVQVRDRTALDVGASAGGFTSALLSRGIRRVYAVDVGVEQLIGSLRADPRVVDLQGTNLSALDVIVVPDAIDLLTVDVSYLSLRAALPQLTHVCFSRDADLVALVKPTFELRRASLAASDADIEEALTSAARGCSSAGWLVIDRCEAPPTGRHRAREVFLHARRTGVKMVGAI